MTIRGIARTLGYALPLIMSACQNDQRKDEYDCNTYPTPIRKEAQSVQDCPSTTCFNAISGATYAGVCCGQSTPFHCSGGCYNAKDEQCICGGTPSVQCH